MPMNLYLATSHVLTLLETPISEEAFAVAVAANPLFASSCMSPRRWLLFLADEGLLIRKKHMYQLGSVGLLLQRQVLNWTPPSDEQRTARRIAYQARRSQPVAALDPACPACGSGFCALYIFVILLERLYEGLEGWNNWRTGEKELIRQALPQVLLPAPQQLFLLAETYPVAKADSSLALALNSCLDQWPDLRREPEWRNDFELRSQQRLLLQPLPDLEMPVQYISRLRLSMGLMKSEQLLYLHALADPELYPQTAQVLKQTEGLPKAEFVRICRPGLNPEGNQALLLLMLGARVQLIVLRRQRQQWCLDKLLLEC